MLRAGNQSIACISFIHHINAKKKVKEKIPPSQCLLVELIKFYLCFACNITQGCDASVLVASTKNNKAEKDHPDNVSLAGDGFDTVIKAKEAVDAVPLCRNKVSCADILALATRDVIELVCLFMNYSYFN